MKRLRVPTLKQAQYEFDMMQREETRKRKQGFIKDRDFTVEFLDFTAPNSIVDSSTKINNPQQEPMSYATAEIDNQKAKPNIEAEVPQAFKNLAAIDIPHPVIPSETSNRSNDTVPQEKLKRKPGRPRGKNKNPLLKLRENFLGRRGGLTIQDDDDADDESENKTPAKNMKVKRNEERDAVIGEQKIRRLRRNVDKFSDADLTLDECCSHSDKQERLHQQNAQSIEEFKTDLFSHILGEINRKISVQSFQATLLVGDV